MEVWLLFVALIADKQALDGFLTAFVNEKYHIRVLKDVQLAMSYLMQCSIPLSGCLLFHPDAVNTYLPMPR